MYVTQIFSGPTGEPSEPDELTEHEREALDNERRFQDIVTPAATGSSANHPSPSGPGTSY